MEWKKISKALVKFIGKEANVQELEALEIWLKDEQNEPKFNLYVKLHLLTIFCMKDFDTDKAKKEIQRRVDRNRKGKRLVLYKGLGMAASIALLIGFALFHPFKKTDGLPSSEKTGSESNNAVLTLENGEQVTLEKGTKYQTDDASSNGEKITYKGNDAHQKPSSLKYHYLTIPRGSEFSLELPDGTKVRLNSESQLKYPLSFPENEKRVVELVYGEAYFDVSPSEMNKGMAFEVISASQRIEVMGTEFNLKAYKEDTDITTTLVEGRIAIQKGNAKSILNPDQQSKTYLGSDAIEISDVDTEHEISWTKGLFSFEEETLDEIMKTLSRWYDVEVFFDDVERKAFLFTGVLNRTSSIADILRLIEKTSAENLEFIINDKVVIVK